ncbi:MAG: CoA pyrophosphatase [Hyphomicrobiales bacterium]|nr:CoA pyrophosphatase [Hyphomicrobiales bacterium]
MTNDVFERFLRQAADGLRADVPLPGDTIHRPRSDVDLETEPVGMPDETALKPAAVLVPIVRRPGGAAMLFTQRSAALRRHSGQISFPGGRIDEADASPLAAALREAEEEIGLPRERVTPLGYLDAYLTGTGYRIIPVVGLIEAEIALMLNPSEVDEAFEVPLDYLMDPANHRRDGREWNGRYRSYYAISYGERYIWGATAGIVRNLHDRLMATAVVNAGSATGKDSG